MKHLLLVVAAAMLAAAPVQAGVGDRMPRLEEASEIVDNVMYRYVYEYNSAGERTKETVYSRVRQNDVWGEESLMTVGTYAYTYDGMGRVTSKTVDYAPASRLGSYKLEMTYGDDTVEFKRYDKDGSNLTLESGWSVYTTGELASTVKYYHEEGVNHIVGQVNYDRKGNVTGTYSNIRGDEQILTVDGVLNDSTITHTENRVTGGPSSHSITDHYRYDPATGKIVYIEQRDKYSWGLDEMEYDDFGRLVSWVSYDAEGVSGQAPTKYSLTNDIKYEYYNDEVYGIGNSWHDVFGFYGPVKNMVSIYHEDDGRVTTERATFTRDDDGRLLSIDYTNDDSKYPMTGTFTVDAAGQITRKVSQNVYYNEVETVDYTWIDGQCVMERSVSSNESDPYTVTYAYGENSVTVSQADDYVSITTKATRDAATGHYTVHQHKKYSYGHEKDIYFANDVQQADISFVKPDIMKDIEGARPNRTIVVSQKGRVVAALYDSDRPYGSYGYGQMDNYPWDEEWYINLPSSEYFAVTYDGDRTICSDIEGQPVYVLSGGLLRTEYQYYEVASNIESRSISLPEGMYCDEITYHYSESGMPLGQSIVSIDPDGVRSEPVEIDYVYDASVDGIQAISIPLGYTLAGRTLQLSDGEPFSVVSLDGRVLASGVEAYTFAAGGVYIVSTERSSVKVHVR